MSANNPAINPEQFIQQQEEQEGGGLNLIEIWRSVTLRKFQIIGLGLVCALLALVIVSQMTPIYKAKTTVMFEMQKGKVVLIEQAYSISPDQQFFQTQTEILKSRDLALKTISKLRLWEHPDYDPRKKKEDWFSSLRERLGISVVDDAKDKAAALTDQQLAEAVYGAFKAGLTVAPVGRNQQLVDVSFESPDRELAAKVANTHAETFISNDMAVRFELSNKAGVWLRDQLKEIKEQLTKSEQALQEFRDAKGLVDIGGSTQTAAASKSGELRSRLIEAQVKRADAEIAYQQIKNAGSRADLSAVPAVQRNPAVAEAQRRVVEAERKLAEMSDRYGPEHPKMAQTRAELASARSALQSQIDQIVAGFTREYEQAKAQEQALSRSLSASEEGVRKINRYEFDLGVLQREVESNRQLYNMFLSRGKETNISADLQNPVARIVDQAVVSGAPVRPLKDRIVLIALVVGLLLGAGAAVALDAMDRTVKTTEEAERKLLQPVLTTLPILPKESSNRSSAIRVLLDQPESIFSESIRTARSGIMLSALDETQRTIMVTSTLPGEGKTVFAMGIAEALVQQGVKTLLIECDMRRPTIARSLDLDPALPGLSSLVAGKAGLSECVHFIQGSGLHIIIAGAVPPNPQELLASRRFKETLEKLKEHYEAIVLDSPPVELVADAQVLAPLVTGIAYMVKASETPIPLIQKNLIRLQRAGGNVMGVVLTQLDFRKAHRYYGEYSGYGRGSYKYGYYRGYGAYSHAYGHAYSSNAGKEEKAAATKA